MTKVSEALKKAKFVETGWFGNWAYAYTRSGQPALSDDGKRLYKFFCPRCRLDNDYTSAASVFHCGAEDLRPELPPEGLLKVTTHRVRFI